MAGGGEGEERLAEERVSRRGEWDSVGRGELFAWMFAAGTLQNRAVGQSLCSVCVCVGVCVRARARARARVEPVSSASGPIRLLSASLPVASLHASSFFQFLECSTFLPVA